jgi:tetratricopeptide (TPR) repeat protein
VGPVTEQSEHLSSAQIENYGIRTSGAGPEAAQRDEHQRADQRMADKLSDDQSAADQSMIDQRSNDQRRSDQDTNDQRIEAHLADCASCRNRLLDFHRSLFASPTYQPEPDRTMAGDPKNDHTNSALADSKFANPKDPADPQVRTAATPECPSDDALRQLAAGLTPDDVAAKLTQHAATCHHCGPLLRTYTELFSDDFSAEEQAALNQLKSASPKWQQQTAREMLKRAIPPAPSPRPVFSWKWIMVPALPVVALIAVGIWYLQRDTPEQVARLEAQGYTEQRTIEMRVPYAAYADFNQRRSGDTPSRSALPPSLNQAADKIAKHLEKEADDPQWLMLSARLDLLDWNYKSALSTLEKISDAQIVESPEYLMTRAFALFQKSEALKESQGYSEAVDLLDKALQKVPNDPVLLFNQAIACEKIHSYECAESDWNRLLAVEKDPQWSAEARKHLDQIREKKTPAR